MKSHQSSLLSPCALYKHCKHHRVCTSCEDFQPFQCSRRDVRPGVCNACSSYSTCRFTKNRYQAKTAQHRYERNLVDSRAGVDLAQEDLNRLASIVVAPLKQGQSPYAVIANHPGAGLSVSTLYRYILQGVFQPWACGPLTLRWQVKRKPLKRKTLRYKKRKDRFICRSRTYQDYLNYKQEHPSVSVVQMDTLYNKQGGPYLQTFKFLLMDLLIAFYHEKKTAQAMIQGVDRLQALLGDELFHQFCPIILTDNGSEFSDPVGIEKGLQGSRNIRMFSCEPMQAG